MDDEAQKFPNEAVAAVHRARAAVAARYLQGEGIEVGAGSRVFPVPKNVHVIYGDIRDHSTLEAYFGGDEVRSGRKIDAQTFAGINDDSLDFVISAHVIEHLRDPIGSLANAFRILKPEGLLILAVPDMRFTFDVKRPETTVEHLLEDFRDGGAATCRQAFEEHLRFVHPYFTGEHYSEEEIEWQVTENTRRWWDFDIHYHAWTQAGFEALLAAVAKFLPLEIEEAVQVVNENIFVLRKRRNG